MVLHVHKFGLGSAAVFSKTEARAPTSVERASCLSTWKAMQFRRMVWIRAMVIFRWLFFFFFSSIDVIDRVAVVTLLNSLILIVN